MIERNFSSDEEKAAQAVRVYGKLALTKYQLKFGGVAQLGEHLPCKQGVRSSILLISTKFAQLHAPNEFFSELVYTCTRRSKRKSVMHANLCELIKTLRFCEAKSEVCAGGSRSYSIFKLYLEN